METEDGLKLAVRLSLVAGILIPLVGVISVPGQWNGTWWRHGGAVWLSSFAVSLMIVAGALTTVSAIFLYKNPQHHVIFGLIILLSSPLSLISLGIASPEDISSVLIIMVGGALGVTYRHKEKSD